MAAAYEMIKEEFEIVFDIFVQYAVKTRFRGIDDLLEEQLIDLVKETYNTSLLDAVNAYYAMLRTWAGDTADFVSYVQCELEDGIENIMHRYVSFYATGFNKAACELLAKNTNNVSLRTMLLALS